MLLANVEASVDHAMRVCDFLRSTLPAFHPLLVLQEMTLGELLQEQERDEESVALLTKIIPALELLYGTKHKYVKRANENIMNLIKAS